MKDQISIINIANIKISNSKCKPSKSCWQQAEQKAKKIEETESLHNYTPPHQPNVSQMALFVRNYNIMNILTHVFLQNIALR